MLADRLEHYASTFPATAPGSPQWQARVLAGLVRPLRSALRLACTTALTAELEAQALGDACSLHARLCTAHLPHALIWVELPAEEKERVREALLAARGQSLAAHGSAAACALTLGLLLAREGGMRQVAISLVVEVIDPTNGPGLVLTSSELLLDLPTALPPGAALDVDAVADTPSVVFL